MDNQGNDSILQTDTVGEKQSTENVDGNTLCEETQDNDVAREIDNNLPTQSNNINNDTDSQNVVQLLDISQNLPVTDVDSEKIDKIVITIPGDISSHFTDTGDINMITDAHIINPVPHDNENLRNKMVSMEIIEENTLTNDETFKSGTLKPRKSPIPLFTEDTGPQMYKVNGNIVTPPILTKNLPEIYKDLPIFGRPSFKSELNSFYNDKIRKFVGSDLDDKEFEELDNYCSPENLKTGNELVMNTTLPDNTLLTNNILESGQEAGNNLCTVKKYKMRVTKDVKCSFSKKLKYRSTRVLPYPKEDAVKVSSSEDMLLEPGKDLLFKIRVYRPFTFISHKERTMRSRHSLLCSDVVLTGRHTLTALRDRFVCHNDFDMRVDVSNNPDMVPKTKAKEVFPSGFLFINNVFYVDTREGCIDYSKPIREWAIRKGIGEFQKRDMCKTRLDEILVKLGYPDMYMHQGNCEHIFVFSEIRLLNASDPLRFSLYPCSTAVGQNQIMYCTTCAEFSAKWIVSGCSRIPFDPAYFCDTCFKQYLYKDGRKIGDFKAYTYRGNALNVLKPQ